jgi:hypothetical protein
MGLLFAFLEKIAFIFLLLEVICRDLNARDNEQLFRALKLGSLPRHLAIAMN